MDSNRHDQRSILESLLSGATFTGPYLLIFREGKPALSLAGQEVPVEEVYMYNQTCVATCPQGLIGSGQVRLEGGVAYIS